MSPIAYDPSVNPFTVLLLIAAPAILTNASSVLTMSSSNRLARAVDRTRELARQLEASESFSTEEAERRLQELEASHQRSQLLLRALRSFYIAVGCFATATLLSVLGAVFVTVDTTGSVKVVEVLALLAGGSAVAALITGSFHLARETRIAVAQLGRRAVNLQLKAQEWRQRHQQHGK